MQLCPNPFSLREAVIQYAAQRYGSRPADLWSNAPNFVVLRHEDSKKWYGLIMDIPNVKLSLPGPGRTDLLEIKCDMERMPELLAEGKIMPAYHMKKGDWAAVRLDGSVPLSDVKPLLDMSYQVTGSDSPRTVPNPQAYVYSDEPIALSPERARTLPPKAYRALRRLASDSPFTTGSDARIFYQQALLMENFTDDCPYEREVLRYYPTYESFSTQELRGYFTWRTRLRQGEVQKTSLSYAYLYFYELLHQIGSRSKEEGFEKLTWFSEKYEELDPSIRRYARQWILDYAIYYDIPREKLIPYIDGDFDRALDILRCCENHDDPTLFSAILTLSTYQPEKSRAYKQFPAEMEAVICTAYRRLNARYSKRYDRPYADKLFGGFQKSRYFPFRGAVFFDKDRREHYAYSLSPVQKYSCDWNAWSVERAFLSPQKKQDFGLLVRAADRLMRESYDLKPLLKPGSEGKTMVSFLTEAIAQQKKPVVPKIEFDLSLLGGIRRSADAIGEKLMTEEERYTEAEPEAAPAEAEDSLLTGPQRRFLEILLYGGDLQSFLSETHQMASILAESVNEQLFEEFADTVIEFDGDTPVIVEDYIDELKGLIPT